MRSFFFKSFSSYSKGCITGFVLGGASTYFFNRNPSTHILEKNFVYPKTLKEKYDYLAPDGSEIRYYEPNISSSVGELVNCRLPKESTTIAVRHKTVDEIWYIKSGSGELWLRQSNGKEHVYPINPNMSITIPKKTAFQFRNTSPTDPLEIIITTMPPWPGASEAELTAGKWASSINPTSTSRSLT